MNIEKCEQCPFLLLDHKNMISGCHNTERGILVIDDISLIPDWCPLPDVEKKKIYCEICGNEEVKEQGDWCDKCLNISK